MMMSRWGAHSAFADDDDTETAKRLKDTAKRIEAEAGAVSTVQGKKTLKGRILRHYAT